MNVHEQAEYLTKLLAQAYKGPCEEWDATTIEAIHLFCTLHHGGQWCPLYEVLCSTEFTPGMGWSESAILEATEETDSSGDLIDARYRYEDLCAEMEVET